VVACCGIERLAARLVAAKSVIAGSAAFQRALVQRPGGPGIRIFDRFLDEE
jgi:hypothetical protein